MELPPVLDIHNVFRSALQERAQRADCYVRNKQAVVDSWLAHPERDSAKCERLRAAVRARDRAIRIAHALARNPWREATVTLTIGKINCFCGCGVVADGWRVELEVGQA